MELELGNSYTVYTLQAFTGLQAIQFTVRSRLVSWLAKCLF